MPPSKGYKSSEFWITIVVVVVGAAIATGLIPSEGIAMKIAATILMTAKALGYTISRTILKAGSIASADLEELAAPAAPTAPATPVAAPPSGGA